NLQERIFLLCAMKFLLDDEIHLPQLMQSCGATSVFQRFRFAVRPPGKFRVLMQEAFDRPPIWECLESATTQLSLNKLPTPTEMLSFGLEDRCARPRRSPMRRLCFWTSREPFKPLLTEFSKTLQEFLDAALTQAEPLSDLGDW